jgi:hypothetical protein
LARIGAGIDRKFFGRSRRAERKKTQSPALVTGVEIADESWLAKSVLTSSWTRSRIAFDGVGIFTADSIGQRIASEQSEGRTDALGQIAVDVGVHTGERELDAGDSARRSGAEERAPGRGRPRDVPLRIQQRREIQIRKDDIERSEERGVVERDAADRCAHAERDTQIETIEPLHTIAVRQPIVDRLHDRDDAVDRFGRHASQDVVEDRHDYTYS